MSTKIRDQAFIFYYNFILDFEIHELNSLGDAIQHSPDKLILQFINENTKVRTDFVIVNYYRNLNFFQ